MERFTISLDERLAQQLDAWLAERSYSNRSKAIRDLLRAELGRVEPEYPRSAFCIACVSYVYNHHERDLQERITTLYHENHDLAVSSMHVHLDHDHCMETAILRGAASRAKQLADAVCAERGVHHSKFNLIGVELQEPHGDERRARSNRPPHPHLRPKV